MKFRIKVTLSMISILAVLFGIGGSMLINTSFQKTIEREEKAAEKSYNMMLNTLILVSETTDWTSDSDLFDTIARVSEQDEFFTAIELSTDEHAIFTNNPKRIAMDELTDYTDSTHIAYQLLAVENNYYYQLCGRFEANGKPMFLTAAYDLTSIYALHEQQEEIYRMIFGCLIVIGTFAVYLLAYLLTEPLVHLKEVASEIAAGNYEVRSEIRTSDEIGSLSEEFDRMANTLVGQMDELNDALERKNRFISDFTHEIKTPMTSIIGYADLLRGEGLSKEEAADAAHYIFTESRRLESLSIKMLDLIVSNTAEPVLVPRSPADLIEHVTEHLKKEYEQSKIMLKVSCEDGICLIEPDFFVSLLVNLVENARRAMPDGGELFIENRMTEEGCILKVTDTGCGIPEDALAHLTEEFYRVDKARSRAFGGAGLGLSLCDRIVKMHKGMIEVESTVGIGTTFTVTVKGGRA